jgi:D-erythro-7,8-dihydroneopterin triphosphate epimerase
MIIRIKNLLVRIKIGVQPAERDKLQDVLINLLLETDDPAATDQLVDTIDYKEVTKKIIAAVEQTRFLLIETLARFVLDLVMEEKRVKRAVVEIDKPHALRFSESVSVTMERLR